MNLNRGLVNDLYFCFPINDRAHTGGGGGGLDTQAFLPAITTLIFKPKKIECPKIQTQENRMTQDAMVVKV